MGTLVKSVDSPKIYLINYLSQRELFGLPGFIDLLSPIILRLLCNESRTIIPWMQ
jgi:hypothetical protein